jgi:hypothetical protein
MAAYSSPRSGYAGGLHQRGFEHEVEPLRPPRVDAVERT